MNKKSIKEYRVWRAMKARCYAPSQIKGNYKRDGIEVCERWRNSFDNFIADMGMMPGADYSIERINVKGNYEPDNCKWIPMREQPKNRSNSIMIMFNGELMCLKDISRALGIKYTTLYKWYRKAGSDLKMVDEKIREYYGLSTNKHE